MSGPDGLAIAGVLARRELVHLVRRPARLAGALGTPLFLWVFLASGFAESFRPPGEIDASYGGFLLPGVMTLIVVFAAIFSSLSVIEDRNSGWLRAAPVSPAPRWSIAGGRIAGGAASAFFQSALLLPAVLVLDLRVGAAGLAATAAALAVTAVAMSALGLIFAWRSETTAGFHAVMNLVFMPMWLLSGALFPPAGAAPWLATLVHLNPLTWCTRIIRDSLTGGGDPASWGLAIAFAAVMTVMAVWVVGRKSC